MSALQALGRAEAVAGSRTTQPPASENATAGSSEVIR